MDPSSNRTTEVQRLFITHSSVIKGLIASLLPDFNLVDDVLHEVFLVVTQRADAFEPGSSFLGWASAIARRKVLEVCRDRRRTPASLAPEVVESLCAAFPTEDFGDLTQARHAALAECLEQLPPRAQAVIRMRYREAHRPAEIAQRIGWTAESVYVALSRARAALRECVGRKLAGAGVE
jgi:RNA polymerase sigma-70 factor (ECF subfamily)